jgi:predicted MFS family arabinose efflux permease
VKSPGLPSRLGDPRVFAITGVVLVNVIDFMIILPLGADISQGLGFDASNLGLLGGSYTGAAMVGGLIASFIVDRLDRRLALVWAMLVLTAATLATGLATNLPMLLASRALAGLFAGPSVAIAYALITDLVPEQRRGAAMAIISSTFPVSSVVIIPVVLALSGWVGWRVPFVATAALGLVATLVAYGVLPPVREHLAGPGQSPLRADLLLRASAQLALLLPILSMLSSFTLTPLMPSYLTDNLAVPRSHLQGFYFTGGVLNFIALRWVGRWVDRSGAVRVAAWSTAAFAAVLGGLFFTRLPEWAALLCFVGFMVASSARGVALNTLLTRVPGPTERGRFQSFRAMFQDAGATAGALLSAQLVSRTAEPLPQLRGMPALALFALAATLLIPAVMTWLASQLRVRDAEHKTLDASGVL